MTENDAVLDRLVRDWWKYHRLARGSWQERAGLERGEPADASEARSAVAERVERGGAAAVALIEALCRAEPDGDGGMTVGCGPLEDLVHLHGDMLIEELEQSARRSEAVARALAHVWLEPGHVTATTAERLSRWIAPRS
ncbi:MAG TPA: hypothetical protein VFT67_10115 [Jatrophihabitantaceae bacterium]|nr:hypothetical protein [Jatrophihabitantaceae bacterium]